MFRLRPLTWLLWVALAFVPGLNVQAQSAGTAERRVALVVGNSAYRLSPLKNPKNDVRAVSNALRKLNFEVIEREDLGREAFSMAVREFGDRLKGASVGMFYFAGHGLQVKARNYLVPVDVDIAREDEVPYRGLDINEVLDKMDSARTPINLVVLDACRNNPFARSFKLSQVGLAQMDAPQGTLISFATAPGSVAQDGDGANGLFTGALLKHIGAPGLAVEQMLKRVRVDVMRGSNNLQVPWESSSLNRDFAFAPALREAAAAPTPVKVPGSGAAELALALELAFWESIGASRNPADYQAYLEQYPQGRFAALARVRGQNPASGGTLIYRYVGESAPRMLDLGTAASVSASAQSPEGHYLVAVSGDQLHWVDMKEGRVLRRTGWSEWSAAPIVALEFSATGRWLLLKTRKQGQFYYELVDVATGVVLWSKPGSNAVFDAQRPLIHLQDVAGQLATVELPS